MFKPFIFVALSSLLGATASVAQSPALLFHISPKVATSAKFKVPMVAIPKRIKVSQAINKQILAQIMAHLDYISVPVVSNTSVQYLVDNLATIANIDPEHGVQGINYTILYQTDEQILINIIFKHDIAIAEKHEYDLAFDLNTGAQIATTDIADLNELTDIDIFMTNNIGRKTHTNNTIGAIQPNKTIENHFVKN
jgi:hypothetical protein